MPADDLPGAHSTWLNEVLGVVVLNDGKKIAGGGFGIVYLGKLNERKVVMKRQPLEPGEADVIGLDRVGNHPHIVELLASGVAPLLDDGSRLAASRHYMVLEHLDAELFDVLQGPTYQGVMPETAAWHFFKQLLRGVARCHERGVAHRDIKLENVMVVTGGDQNGGQLLKLVDFGLAHVFPPNGAGGYEVTPLNQVVGSPAYVAPEVLACGHGLLGVASYHAYPTDLWSMGVLLFTLVAGFFPFDTAKLPQLPPLANGAPDPDDPGDWRFARVAEGQRHGRSLVHTVFGFYHRPVFLSARLVELLDALLSIDVANRPTVTAVARFEWVRHAPGSEAVASSQPQQAAAAGGGGVGGNGNAPPPPQQPVAPDPVVVVASGSSTEDMLSRPVSSILGSNFSSLSIDPSMPNSMDHIAMGAALLPDSPDGPPLYRCAPGEAAAKGGNGVAIAVPPKVCRQHGRRYA